MWSPEWITSVVQERPGQSGPGPKDGSFIKDPNLTEGRITKHGDGTQTIEVSGDNLVTILDNLFASAYRVGRVTVADLVDVAPNRAACGPLYERIRAWLNDTENTSAGEAGNTLVLDERIAGAKSVEQPGK